MVASWKKPITQILSIQSARYNWPVLKCHGHISALKLLSVRNIAWGICTWSTEKPVDITVLIQMNWVLSLANRDIEGWYHLGKFSLNPIPTGHFHCFSWVLQNGIVTLIQGLSSLYESSQQDCWLWFEMLKENWQYCLPVNNNSYAPPSSQLSSKRNLSGLEISLLTSLLVSVLFLFTGWGALLVLGCMGGDGGGLFGPVAIPIATSFSI